MDEEETVEDILEEMLSSDIYSPNTQKARLLSDFLDSFGGR